MTDLRTFAASYKVKMDEANDEVASLKEKGVLGEVSDIAAMDLPNKLSEQFAMYARLSTIAAGMSAIKAEAKALLAFHTAELFIGYKNSEEKMTETLIKSRIETSEGVYDFKRFLAHLDATELSVNGALEAFRQRHFILKCLTDIYTTSVIGAENG